MRSGSRHLVHTCTWLIVAHRHARTSNHSVGETESVSEWERVVFHVSPVLVSGHLRIMAAHLAAVMAADTSGGTAIVETIGASCSADA